jgi:hypothetical protein
VVGVMVFTRSREDAKMFFAQRRKERRGVAPAALPRGSNTGIVAAALRLAERNTSASSAPLREQPPSSLRVFAPSREQIQGLPQ